MAYSINDTIQAQHYIDFVGTPTGGPRATGTITFALNPANNDTITLNGTTWTFVTAAPSGNQTQIAGSLALTLDQLVIDLNGSVDSNLTVATYTEDGTVLTITYDTQGTAGNAYTLAASVATASGATLTGGVDDSNKVTVPFTNALEATDVVSGIYGVGFGDRGYGQTGVSLRNPTSSDVITSADWTDMRTAINNCALHQGTATTLLPPAASLAVGQVIEAHESSAPTLDPYDFGTMVANIDTNRFNTDSGFSIDTNIGVHTSSRASVWSANINTTITATWPTENEARYFFNSGGELRIRFSHPNGTSSQDDNWRTVFSGLGNIDMLANSVTRSGTLGTIVGPGGYYGLTTVSQNILDGTNVGTGAYTANDVFIGARYSLGDTSNGAKGRQIEFIITLQDQHTNAFFDSVAAGTIVTFDVFYAGVSSELTGITLPTWATTESF